MSHLGSQLSALVDGQLPPALAERALEHVAACSECAAELRAARAAREALWAADDVAPAPDLTARLLALGGPRRASGAAGDGRPVGEGHRGRVVDFNDSVPLPGHEPVRVPRDCLRGDVVHRRVPRSVAVAAVGCVGAFVGGLVALGGQPTVVPETQRSYALALLADAPDEPPAPGASTGGGGTGARSTAAALRLPDLRVPVIGAGAEESGAVGPRAVVQDVSLTGTDAHSEVLSWMADHGWSSPVALPGSFRVTALRLETAGPGSLELDLVGPSGPVVVLQEPGRLHPDVAGALPVADVGGREVLVVCSDPWYVVWQSGDSVVSVVADRPSAAVRELVAAHPAAAYDDGVGARLSRGWGALTGSWVP